MKEEEEEEEGDINEEGRHDAGWTFASRTR